MKRPWAGPHGAGPDWSGVAVRWDPTNLVWVNPSQAFALTNFTLADAAIPVRVLMSPLTPGLAVTVQG
jgi:hypothetical protein